MEALEINKIKMKGFDLRGVCVAGIFHNTAAFYLTAFCERRRLLFVFFLLMQTLKPCCIAFYFELLFVAHEWCVC